MVDPTFFHELEVRLLLSRLNGSWPTVFFQHQGCQQVRQLEINFPVTHGIAVSARIRRLT
jgi:hypothetical protein